MKRLAIAIALSLFLAVLNIRPANGQSSQTASDTVRTLDLKDCKILRIFDRLWKKHSPLIEQERAVWIVLNPKSGYESIDWLRTPERNITVWYDPLPDHIVAQAHTHGDQLDPKPSRPDIAAARYLKVPIYMLSRKGIWTVTPDGVITQELVRGWYKDTMKKCGNDLASK